MSHLNSEAMRLIQYLGFKFDCAREQQEAKVHLDIDHAKLQYDKLEEMQNHNIAELTKVMPKKPIYIKKDKPKQIYKKNGDLTSAGETWFEILQKNKLPPTTVGPVTVLTGYQQANPNSHEQVKDWLFGLGWKPATFKYVKNDDGTERSIPQIKDGDELCESVSRLAEVVPEVQLLVDMGIIQHRKGLFKSFLENAKDGSVVAGVGGLTNTFRFKHRKPICNLPKVGVPWGSEVRATISAPDGYIMCGSDMVSLESTTKRHYMYPFDPDYVNEMSKPGFDEHLDLAAFAGAVTREQVEQHKQGTINLKSIRQAYKQTNYSAVYGIGKAKLARTLDISVKDAGKLLEAYWERNHAVKKATEQFVVKQLGPYLWVQNPVSKFWHNLRTEKDAFSTVNQSTGVYCFDTWVYYARKAGIKVSLQMHDEIGFYTQQPDEAEAILKEAINKTNDKLKLNVELDVDVKFGQNYSQTH